MPRQRPQTNSKDQDKGDAFATRKPLAEKDILCLGHLQRVFGLLDRLHQVGCGRDKAGNRELFFDDYCKLVLLHTQLDLATFAPHRLDRTGARNGGENRESQVLRRTLEAGRCYVGDGGYADQKLFREIEKAESSFVMRTREDAVNEVVEERLLSEEALEAGIVRDALVSFRGDQDPTPYVVRRVEIQVRPHERRVRGGFKQSDLIVLYSSLREELAPELITAIYQYRYTVELFFRILKQLLGLRHLISQREEGIDIQVCCAVIVCILIQLISGKRPNKAMRNMIGWYLLGLAGEAEVIAFLNQPDHTGVKLRAKEELWKKLGL